MSDYNASGYPGRFELRREQGPIAADGAAVPRFAVIGVADAGADGKLETVMPLLDAEISILAAVLSDYQALGLVYDAVEKATGTSVVDGAMMVPQAIQAYVSVGGKGTARTVLVEILNQLSDPSGYKKYIVGRYEEALRNRAIAIRSVRRQSPDGATHVLQGP